MASSTNSTQNDNVGAKLDFTLLPMEKRWIIDDLYQFRGFWFDKPILEGILDAQQFFKPQPNDVILTTFPKSGTTWFAALLITILNRSRYDFSDHPLLHKTPQECLSWIEFPSSIVTTLNTQVLKTHTPYTLLQDIIKSTTCMCPIIYVCRNPADVFVSLYHFANKLRPKQLPRLALDEAFDMFCKGVCGYGSYWDHVLEYWKASRETPEKILFFKYEDMKKQPIAQVKKLAEFVGCPFSVQEEQDGLIDKIVDFCSFESLTSLKVNQDTTEHASSDLCLSNSSFFRKAKIGDYRNHLTDEMIQRIKQITSIKFKDTGLVMFAE